MIGAALVLLGLTAAGGGLCRALGLFTPALGRAERAALAFGAGSLWATTALFWLALAGVPLSRWTALAALLPCFLGWFGRADAPEAAPAEGGGRARPFAIALLMLVVLRALLACLAEPVTVGDAYLNWQLKGLAFHEDGALDPILRREPSPAANLDYPLHVPLWSTFLYCALGAPDDLLVKTIHCACLAAILALAAGALRRRLGGSGALLGAALLGASPALVESAASALADVPLAFLLLAAALALRSYAGGRDGADLRRAAVFLYGCAWTKNEGLPLALLGAALAALLALRARRARDLAMLGPLLLLAPWIAYRVSLGVASGHLAGGLRDGLAGALARLPEIAGWLAAEALEPRWLLLWPGLLFLLGHRLRARPPAPSGAVILLLLIGGMLAVYAGVYAATAADHLWLLQTTRTRLLLHLAPAALVAAGLLLADPRAREGAANCPSRAPLL